MTARRAAWVLALTAVLAMITAAAVTVVGNAGANAGSAGPLAVHDSPRPIEPFTFADGDGAERAISDFRGQVVVLNLWATWCPPCREEMPTLDALQARLSGEDLAVVALSVDQGGADVVREFYRATGVEHLDLYIDPTMDVMARLRVRGLPTTLVLDRNGDEVARLAGKADWTAPAIVDYLRGLIGGGHAAAASGAEGSAQR